MLAPGLGFDFSFWMFESVPPTFFVTLAAKPDFYFSKTFLVALSASLPNSSNEFVSASALP